MAKMFFKDCCVENIPLAVLLTFCSEGDNIPDAINLASYLNQWLQLIPQTMDREHRPSSRGPWILPSSWQLLFGSGVKSSIY